MAEKGPFEHVLRLSKCLIAPKCRCQTREDGGELFGMDSFHVRQGQCKGPPEGLGPVAGLQQPADN